MARKFSLKDNPIFQRLEIPQPRSLDTSTSVVSVAKEEEKILLPSSEHDLEEKIDPQILTLKNRPSNFDPDETPRGTLRENAFDLEPTSQQSEYKHEAEESVSFKTTPPSPEPSGIFESDKLVPSSEQVESPLIFDPQILTLTNRPSNMPSESPPSRDAVTEEEAETNITSFNENEEQLEKTENVEVDSLIVHEDSPLGLREHIEKSLFFSFYNEISDSLLPTLETAEQVLYARLFRLSYGFNRNYCTVSQPLLQERTGLSRNTVRTSLQSLLKKELIAVVDSGKHISTTYRIFLPRERGLGSKTDPQKQTLKIRPSNFEGQNQRVKIRGSKNNRPEGQNLDPQNLTLKKNNIDKANKNKRLQTRGANFERQNLPPLLLTNNSLTLREREEEATDEKDNRILTAAKSLVQLFYSKFSLNPTAEKIQRGIRECLSLLKQGFSEAQIIHAIEWILLNHPETGSFSRVTHFIDQALKASEQDKQKIKKENERRVEEERKTNEERQTIEEGRKINEIKTSLTQSELDLLMHEARQLVENEQGNVRFGKETLVQLRIRQLIRERFL